MVLGSKTIKNQNMGLQNRTFFKTYINQLVEDTDPPLENLSNKMEDCNNWRKRANKFQTSSMR